MSEPEASYEAAHRLAKHALARLSALAEAADALSDAELIGFQRDVAALRGSIDATGAKIAGEVAHRSRRALGHSGLAQRNGFASPQAFVQHVTGSTARDATTLVKVGSTVRDAIATDAMPQRPWLREVGILVARGGLSVAHAQAIAEGLGEPRVPGDGADVGVSGADLAAAARVLMREASELDADRLRRRAHELRDELDAAGIEERERRIHEQRSLVRRRLPSGVTQLVLTGDLESSAFLDELCDRALSPRRHGVRFVDPEEQLRAETASDDQRTDEQFLHDALVDLARVGATADTQLTRRIVGRRLPEVRIHVTADAIQSGDGAAYFEGVPVAASARTAQRIACANGVLPIVFSTAGDVLDLGRTSRLFSGTQRIALAARDGGCRVEGCPVPASRTEAHHLTEWGGYGESNIDEGILLCRFHHMLTHNNGWRVIRESGGYWWVPPSDVDPSRTPRPMPTKSPAQRELARSRALARAG